MLKKSEQFLHAKLKLFAKKDLSTTCLDNDEYKKILSEMALNIKDPDDVTNLYIKNNSMFALLAKENKRSENIDTGKPDEKIKTESIFSHDDEQVSNLTDNYCNKALPSHSDARTYKHNMTESGIDNGFKKQTADDKNMYKSDLQSLLIMMTIDSIEPDDTQSSSNKKTDDIFSSTQLTPTNHRSYEYLNKILNITSLKNDSNRQKYIMKKYFKKWENFVNFKKEDRVVRERKENVNKFLNKLAMKKQKLGTSPEYVRKSKLMVQDYKSYQHRKVYIFKYKVQKQIIALQKAKLEEQNKMIEELKFNKIVEASNQSLEELKDGVRDAYYDIDRHLRPKMKSLSKELKIRELEEPSLMLHCLKVPQFLQRMEARARERDEKHAIIRERRRQIDEERLRLKQQEEIAKAEMNKEEKNKRIKELKEKRKREKIENIRKKQHDERIRALIVMADLHYEKSLITKYGLRPFKLLMQMQNDNMEKAKAHYTFLLTKNIFLHWMWHTEDMWFERNFKAEEFRRKKLLNKTFYILKKNHYEGVLKRQIAEDYYDLYVTQLVFTKFKEAVVVSKKEFEIKWKSAVIYNNSNILFRTFTCWRTLPALNALLREQEMRKIKWRQKVLQVVPDYQPPED